MRTMTDLGGSSSGGRLHTIDSPTSVDCGREVRLRRSLRSLIACCGAFPPESPAGEAGATGGRVTCTFFGQRRGRVSLCVQEDAKAAPILLVELGVPTSYLAREMRGGLLRIALESRAPPGLWCMWCNGRKAGFAVTRRATAADEAVLGLMHTVSVGAGVLPAPDGDEGLLYLRAAFDRVVGSPHSESFHMRNPAGSSGQELSVFLLRS